MFSLSVFAAIRRITYTVAGFAFHRKCFVREKRESYRFLSQILSVAIPIAENSSPRNFFIIINAVSCEFFSALGSASRSPAHSTPLFGVEWSPDW